MKAKKELLKLLYVGKTKDVYQVDETTLLLHTKDTITGWKIKKSDGSVEIVEDPGANEVVGEISGIGLKNLISSVIYFTKLNNAGISNHFLDADLTEKSMLVRKANSIGAGLECIVRFKAMGSIVRTYPDYVTQGQKLNDFFEVTTKNDFAGDPRISREFLTNPDFGPILTDSQYEEMKSIALSAAKIIRDELILSDCELIDIKFEVGLQNNQIILIDEISAGIMRVNKNNVLLSEEDLAEILAQKR
ncbi:MAG: phosphoribosylaminoimidazolesuccinocarboxamide synthase [Candidatus Cloacimonetes bacterium]|nr:phosphoribosylaminoimidazolesuccinocarboxamide synthase [Candidatus Cloacimonadota bacterium]